MWSTFIAMMRVNLRDKSGVFWMVCFPIILATMLQGVFGGISEQNVIEPVPVAVVSDAAWDDVYGAERFVRALAEGGDGETTLVSITETNGIEQAEELLDGGEVSAILAADDDGRIAMTISDTTAAQVRAAQVNGGDATSISLSALSNVLDVFNTNSGIIADAITAALRRDPQLAGDPDFWTAFSDRLGTDAVSYTNEITLTRFTPDPMARYHFALLGMAAMLSMLFSCIPLVFMQANLTDNGARITAGALPKSRMVLGVFLAGWLMSFLSSSIAFLYIRCVLGITVGGREILAEIGLLVASFTASALGLALGAIPKLSLNAKNAISIAISVGLSVPAGLMGITSMALNDTIQREAPLFHLINPVKQVSNLFYDLLYYDTLAPFAQTIAVLLVMSALAVAAATALLRRQRYAHL
ncbi:multidrug ABC transporter permease [Bifidobacterium lemurum]|uniref:Multidrug ABC transporter permease n=1 Tax=Bifidobacterium lemurum TaxID=1603886 RepID=A0A261FN36_9BIFI|nr:ABC transporter permease [Bifidobacterium lemurum]OZG60236.1 multidrug ABC transporter permease [Bifidobacterium lemurum]QOL34132.1 ABC transporter permease [Bifidobacterium lemurum]